MPVTAPTISASVPWNNPAFINFTLSLEYCTSYPLSIGSHTVTVGTPGDNPVNTAVESSPEMNVATLLDASPSIIVESI